MRARTTAALLVFLCMLLVSANVDAQVSDDPIAPRVAYILIRPAGTPSADLLGDSLIRAITDIADAAWIDLGRTDTDEAAIEDRALLEAREWQAEVLILLRLAPLPVDPESPSDFSFRVSYRLLRVPNSVVPEAEELARGETEALADRVGRYQRIENWETFLSPLVAPVSAARPTVSVRFVGAHPFEIEGLPDYVAGRRSSGDGNELVVELRALHSYEVVIRAPGRRSELRRFYLERRPVRFEIELHRYPRHAITATMRGVSWPGIRYSFFPENTCWRLDAGMTTYLLGLTPLDGSSIPGGQSPNDPRIFTSYPLTTLSVDYIRYLTERDRRFHWYVGGGALVRIVTGDLGFGFEPGLPAGLRISFGHTLELPWWGGDRVQFDHRIATDVFPLTKPAFVPMTPWMQQIGPIFIQLPIYHLGLTVVL